MSEYLLPFTRTAEESNSRFLQRLTRYALTPQMLLTNLDCVSIMYDAVNIFGKQHESTFDATFPVDTTTRFVITLTTEPAEYLLKATAYSRHGGRPDALLYSFTVQLDDGKFRYTYEGLRYQERRNMIRTLLQGVINLSTHT